MTGEKLMTGNATRGLAALAALILSSSSCLATVRENGLRIVPVGKPETLYDWSTQHCEVEFIPDSPARAIRRWDGQVVLLATHRENWILVGSSLRSVRTHCQSILRSSEASGRQSLGKVWVQGLFTRDGRTVAALVSEDRAQITKDSGCRVEQGSDRCWLNNILSARSQDGGETFVFDKAPGLKVVSLAPDYPSLARTRYGAFTASNIVTHGDHQYVMIWIDGDPLRRGNCLLRTTDPLESGSWTAWDGSAFRHADNGIALGNTCRPIAGLPNEVRSLTRLSRANVWIAVFASRQKLKGDSVALPGFYFSTSADLINWAPLERIMVAPTRPRESQRTHVMAFPSLIDPDSKSRNFDTIDGDRPFLTYTLHHLKNGSGTMDRDLVAQPMTIEVTRK